ncbi:hypothetical protein [Streptomyces sp. 3N207]|uniref:hypothetical protein n=1 Tax=Streptomyces sp. 3N207 TaxID=3457417 RepID=UPI003FD11547
MSNQAVVSVKADGLVPLSSRLEAEVAATMELIENDWLLRDVWRGLSGEVVSGQQVIDHLVNSFGVLEQAGWARTWREADAGNPVDGLSYSSSLRDVLRAVIWFLKDFAGSGNGGPVTFGDALHGVGDSDSWRVTNAVLSAVLRARTGALTADVRSWSARRGRTLEDLRELAAVAAEVARRIGPEVGGR